MQRTDRLHDASYPDERMNAIKKKRVKKKKGTNTRALKILHEKSRIFEMRRISFLQKNPPKKKFSPATSGRRALRARLPDSHRAERRVNFAR